jgi:hypothetical protein
VKIRTGFVSNSSSASFVVALDKISAMDALKLMAYSNDVRETLGRGGDTYSDWWTINSNFNQGIIRGWTSMDNGDLNEYLEKVGVDTSLFVFEGD